MPIGNVKYVFGPLEAPKFKPEQPQILNSTRHLNGVTAGPIVLSAVCGILLFAIIPRTEAQTLRARISVISVAPARIRVDAEFPNPRNRLSFRNAYGGVIGLGERIERLEAIEASGEGVAAQKLAPGEFQTQESVKHFRYEVNVAEPARPAQMSHVSWLNPKHGLLMLADLLPPAAADSGSFASALISLDVPLGWIVGSNAKHEGAQYSTDDPENAVFLVGPAVHEGTHKQSSTRLSIISSGEWPFSDKDAGEIAGKLIAEYSKLTRFDLKGNAVVMLVPFPGEAGPESWSAETRGNIAVVLLGRNASRKRVLSRLGIVLSHELFHLWVPNALKLSGDYDWFFEGFTLYQALRMDLRLGLISFDGYLETLARVYDSYLSAAAHNRLSLIEASERRWTTTTSLVYDKGMLAAFIYDLSLRNITNCQASVDDVYRQLFRLPARGQGSANETIIKILSERDGLQSFAKDYVESSGTIDLAAVVSSHGIQVQRTASGGTKLAVSPNLNKPQRNLLACIGYRK